MKRWWLYIVEDGDILQVGATTDLGNRLNQRGYPALVYTEGPFKRSEVFRREKQVKGWSKHKKREFIKKSTSQQ